MDNRRMCTTTRLDPSDRRGIADDLRPPQQNKSLRGNLTRNGRSSGGAILHAKAKNDMKIQLHRIEQKAYNAVLLAFSAHSKTITWEKESLLAGLKTELRVTDEEHKELLSTVKSDAILLKIRESRHAGGLQSDSFKHDRPELPQPTSAVSAKQKSNESAPLSWEAPLPSIRSLPLSTPSQPFSSDAKGVAVTGAIDKKIKSSQNLPVVSSMRSAKRHPLASTVGSQVMNKQSNDVPAIDGPAKKRPYSLIRRKTMIKWPADNNFSEAVINDYNQSLDLHLLNYDMGTKDETGEWVNLNEISHEDLRRDCEEPVIHRHTNRDAQELGDKKSHGDGALSEEGTGTSTIKNKSKKDLSLSQNGISKKRKGDDIEILHSETLIMELDKVFSASHSDPHDKKVKRILEQHEQSLIDAIETLVRFSDGESDKYTLRSKTTMEKQEIGPARS